MAIASLIPGVKTSVDKLDLAIDGWIDPEINLRSEIGENETERGVRIHDHYVALPDRLKVTGIVDSVRSSGDRAVDAWQEVMKLHREGAIVTFLAEFGEWKECLIKSVKTIQKTRGLEFMLELQQINRISVGLDNDIEAAAGVEGNPVANSQPIVEAGTKQPVPLNPVVVRQSDTNPFTGEVVDDVLGGSGRSDTVEIVGSDGKPTGRYTLKQPEKEQPDG